MSFQPLPVFRAPPPPTPNQGEGTDSVRVSVLAPRPPWPGPHWSMMVGMKHHRKFRLIGETKSLSQIHDFMPASISVINPLEKFGVMQWCGSRPSMSLMGGDMRWGRHNDQVDSSALEVGIDRGDDLECLGIEEGDPPARTECLLMGKGGRGQVIRVTLHLHQFLFDGLEVADVLQGLLQFLSLCCHVFGARAQNLIAKSGGGVGRFGRREGCEAQAYKGE